MKITAYPVKIIHQCKSLDDFRLGYIPLSYFSSEWSSSKYRISYNTRSVCFFGENNNLLILTYDGCLHDVVLEDKTDLSLKTITNL